MAVKSYYTELTPGRYTLIAGIGISEMKLHTNIVTGISSWIHLYKVMNQQ